MSRSLWRCRNRACPVPHGVILGRITEEGGLVLTPQVSSFRVYLDSQRVTVVCSNCGQSREFRGVALFSSGSGE
jgi:hypothetical protein